MGPPRRTMEGEPLEGPQKEDPPEGLVVGPPRRTRWEGLPGRTWEGGPGPSWDRSHGTPDRRTSWEGQLEGPEKDGQGTPSPRRTSWEGLLEEPEKDGQGTPLLEEPAGKDCCWKDLGMKAWVPPSCWKNH